MAELALSGILAASTCPFGEAATDCDALRVMIDGEVGQPFNRP